VKRAICHYKLEMSFLARPPRRRLHGLVNRLWSLDDSGLVAMPETICPDGCTEFVLHLADAMLQRESGVDRMQPRHLLVAQMDRPVTIVPSGRVAMAGARFVAGALHSLLPTPQDRLSGQILDLEAVWGAWTRRAADSLAHARSAEERLDRLEDHLEALLPPTDTSANARSMRWAASAMRAAGGVVAIERLARDVGISRRQFERRFRDHVGLPPRLFGRIVRFQRAFARLGHESGAHVAAACGYVDQAHLVREVRRFAGQTPTLLAEAEGLTAFFRASVRNEGS
jgi:AraC-like DNA-binding protein